MRERARDRGRLEDIIHYSDNVRQMVEGMQFEDFVKDMRTYFAVMKNIEIVSEAAFMLTRAFQDSHPETPWRVIQGMRHYLVHGFSNCCLFAVSIVPMFMCRQTGNLLFILI